MTTAEAPILELKNIHVVHKTRSGSLFKPGTVHAVNDVSIDVRRGTTIGIVGESGCGKSTLAKVMVGLVGLPQSALEVIPSQISGGQRQRVAIARALALEPDVIVADEPTSALDVSVRAQILNLLSDIKARLGLGMVFISHDIQTVRYVSDTIVVMNAGRIVEQGTAQEVFDSPSDAYTAKLLGAAPSLLQRTVDVG